MVASDLRGKMVMVTGGARGIGRAIAEAFLREGARVAVCDLDLGAAERTVQDLGGEGPDLGAYALDVTSREDFERIFARIESEHAPIDVLVNNAGIMLLGKFCEQPESHDRKQVEVNLFGVINGMRTAIARMQPRGTGHIVNIASMAGKVPAPHAAVYTATKHALVGLTEAVRFEMLGSGVGFSYVMPVQVRTDLIAGASRMVWPPPIDAPEVAAAVIDAVRFGRVEVFVPRNQRVSAILPHVLPRRMGEWLAVRAGLDRMFGHVDAEQRGEYEARASRDDVPLSPRGRG